MKILRKLYENFLLQLFSSFYQILFHISWRINDNNDLKMRYFFQLNKEITATVKNKQ